MRTELYWIEGPWQGQLAILPRPRGGDWLEDEVQGWRAAGVDVVVSLLTSDEVAELDLEQEGRLCEAYDIDFRSFPIVDRSVSHITKSYFGFREEAGQALDGRQDHCHSLPTRDRQVGIDSGLSFGSLWHSSRCSFPAR